MYFVCDRDKNGMMENHVFFFAVLSGGDFNTLCSCLGVRIYQWLTSSAACQAPTWQEKPLYFWLSVQNLKSFPPLSSGSVQAFGKKKKTKKTLCSCRQVPVYQGLTVLQKSSNYMGCRAPQKRGCIMNRLFIPWRSSNVLWHPVDYVWCYLPQCHWHGKDVWSRIMLSAVMVFDRGQQRWVGLPVPAIVRQCNKNISISPCPNLLILSSHLRIILIYLEKIGFQ